MRPLARATDVDFAKVKALQAETSSGTHGRFAHERAGTPNAAREELKAAQRDMVREALARNDEPLALYREFMARAITP